MNVNEEQRLDKKCEDCIERVSEPQCPGQKDASDCEDWATDQSIAETLAKSNEGQRVDRIEVGKTYLVRVRPGREPYASPQMDGKIVEITRIPGLGVFNTGHDTSFGSSYQMCNYDFYPVWGESDFNSNKYYYPGLKGETVMRKYEYIIWSRDEKACNTEILAEGFVLAKTVGDAKCLICIQEAVKVTAMGLERLSIQIRCFSSTECLPGI